MTHQRAALCGRLLSVRVSGCRGPAFLCAAVLVGRAVDGLEDCSADRTGERCSGRGGRVEAERGSAAPVVAGRGLGTEPGGAVRPRLLAEGTSGRKREKPPGGRVVRVRLLPEGALDRKREKPPGGRVVRTRPLPEGALVRSRAGRGRQSGVGAGGQTLTVRMSSRSVV